MSHFFKRLADKADGITSDRETWAARAQAILAGANPVQRDFIKDRSGYKSLRCPRRSGKSYAMTSEALYSGESKPGTRVLIISLTLKSTKENYWSGAPGGLFVQNHRYGLGLKFNHTDLVWWHENGSRGRLAGAETRADVEYLRGAAAEADVCIIDECKSFAPDLLLELIRDVIEPGLLTRHGRLVMGGTPGSIPIGAFWEATSPTARGEDGSITCIPFKASGPLYDDLSPKKRKSLWSLHSWTIQDNLAIEEERSQWERALANKARWGWSDDNPAWRREYLGEWVTDASELVYAYAAAKAAGKQVTWIPKRSKHNVTGLPEADGPWHLVMGLDFGYEDDNALVLAGYSEHTGHLRHVYDFKAPHMTADKFAEEILWAIEKYGAPEMVVGDAGALGKLLVETMNQRYGLSIQPAEKREKYDHIEMLNSDFWDERIQVIQGSDLEHELCGLQFDLSKNSKMILAHTGKLREDPSCPNHLCDALLYLWRFSYHYWSRPRVDAAPRGTPEWWAEQEKAEEARIASRGPKGNADDPFGFKEIRRRERLRISKPGGWLS